MNIRPRFLILAITSRCNLSCRYCYLAATSQGEDMDYDVLDKALSLLGQADQKNCLIQITGGEPTLVPDRIERIIRTTQAMTWQPRLAIQTNATLLTPELIRLLAENHVQVGVSLDGPPEIQERLRGRADATLRGLVLLEEMGVPFRVTTVVSSENILFLDQLALLLAGFSSCRGLGLDLLVQKGRAVTGHLRQATAAKLRQGITALAQTLAGINRHRAHPLRLRELDLLATSRPNRPFCHAATGSSLAVHPDGRLFPCSQTMGEAAFSLGTIWQPKPQKETPLQTIRLTSHECTACLLQNRCPGDCPSRLFHDSDNLLACTLYRSLEAE